MTFRSHSELGLTINIRFRNIPTRQGHASRVTAYPVTTAYRINFFLKPYKTCPYLTHISEHKSCI